MSRRRFAVAQSGLAHLNGVQGVGGSNPLAPINNFKGLQIFCSPFLCHFFRGAQIGVQDFLSLWLSVILLSQKA